MPAFILVATTSSLHVAYVYGLVLENSDIMTNL